MCRRLHSNGDGVVSDAGIVDVAVDEVACKAANEVACKAAGPPSLYALIALSLMVSPSFPHDARGKAVRGHAMREYRDYDMVCKGRGLTFRRVWGIVSHAHHMCV